MEQIKVLRAMSGEERLEVAERLYWSARKMKAAGLRAQHPEWPEPRVQAEARPFFSNARSRPFPVVRSPAPTRGHSLYRHQQRRLHLKAVPKSICATSTP